MLCHYCICCLPFKGRKLSHASLGPDTTHLLASQAGPVWFTILFLTTSKGTGLTLRAGFMRPPPPMLLWGWTRRSRTRLESIRKSSPMWRGSLPSPHRSCALPFLLWWVAAWCSRVRTAPALTAPTEEVHRGPGTSILPSSENLQASNQEVPGGLVTTDKIPCKFGLLLTYFLLIDFIFFFSVGYHIKMMPKN